MTDSKMLTEALKKQKYFFLKAKRRSIFCRRPIFQNTNFDHCPISKFSSVGFYPKVSCYNSDLKLLYNPLINI